MIYVNKYIDDMLEYMNGINKQEEIEKILNGISDQIIDECTEDVNAFYTKSNKYSRFCIFTTLFTVTLPFILNNKLSLYLYIIPFIINIRGILKYSNRAKYNNKLFNKYIKIAGTIHGILFNKCVLNNNNFEGDSESLRKNVMEYFFNKIHGIVNSIYE